MTADAFAEAGPEQIWPLSRGYQRQSLVVGGREFRWGSRTYVMGILNLTRDSFSGDGVGDDVGRAVELTRGFESAGADLIDIGAESSRPGGEPIDQGEELRRLLTPLRAIRDATALPLSVDTWRSETAAAACDAGADLINDIHGFLRDPAMASVVKRYEVPAVVMHNQRGIPVRDVAGDIVRGFTASLRTAEHAGVDVSRLILDPGFGFGWKAEENLAMIRRLPELWRFRLPLLLGVSRKSTLGAVLDAPATDRLEGTIGAVAVVIAAGADIVRVHDVAEVTPAVRIADAIVRAGWRESD